VDRLPLGRVLDLLDTTPLPADDAVQVPRGDQPSGAKLAQRCLELRHVFLSRSRNDEAPDERRLPLAW
jgi:hypothetical protein